MDRFKKRTISQSRERVLEGGRMEIGRGRFYLDWGVGGGGLLGLTQV